jgi:hypothetical protein
MDSSLYTQWVQLAESPQLVQHEQRPSPSSLDDWAKDRSNNASRSAGAASPIPANTTLDISDFTTLGDMGGELISGPLGGR